MQKSISLLPRMAANNIRKNGSIYFPYIGVSVFAIFTYFVFGLILKNDIMYTLPRGVYVTMLVQIGYVLLGLILIPFLYYTNSFLIKRRKRELGLYSILGLEKKHIGIMMFWESLFIYGLVMAGAISLGLLFSRLIFLLLLNLAKMSVNVEFTVSPAAITQTFIFYAIIMGLNLFVNLVQVGKSNPVELMGDSRRGEKEPKRIGFWSLAGLAALVAGYYMAVEAKLDSSVFLGFFLAVFLVVVGTYFLFTSGSIAALRLFKRKKSFYYRPENFITVSGMLYRMKKNAASLSNICVFSTMVIITVVCTVSVYLGMESIVTSGFSRGFELNFAAADMVDRELLKQEVHLLAEKHGVTLEEELDYAYIRISAYQNGDNFQAGGEAYDYEHWMAMSLMTLEEYNRMENASESLQPGEVLIFSSGPDFGYESVSFMGIPYAVKRELTECRLDKKHTNDVLSKRYLVVLEDAEALRQVCGAYYVDSETQASYYYGFWLDGSSEQIDGFSAAVEEYGGSQPGFLSYRDRRENMQDQESMYGGLLFIGIFFGLIFLICLLIIMYYKQITEGFEDQFNFEIMQKVGMGDEEIRRTIRKQISMVFGLPLIGAIFHTIVGMRMVYMLLGAIGFFETGLLVSCTAGGCLVFALVYSFCYKRTSMAYYRIVRKME